MIPRRLPSALLGLALLSTPAAAQPIGPFPPPPDQIVLQLQAEGWIETRTAKLVASVEIVLAGEQAVQQTGRVPPVLNELAQGDWRVTRSDRSRDASGLERWRITAEVRLPETAMGGIYDRARQLSKPGQQLEVHEVDFSPTLAERETTAAGLRAEIYRRAAEEASETAKVWPDRGFRVQRVDFAGVAHPRPMYRQQAMRADAPQAMMAASPEAGDMGVSERMVLTATVVLAAPAPDTGERKESDGK
ncbi:MAG: hypothetical protein ACK4QW_15180 [Alphaproteobacteria bacterium]